MSEKIRILVDDSLPTEMLARSARPSIEDLLRSATGKTIEMEVEGLGQQLSSAYRKVLDALASIPSDKSFQLQSVAFTLAIDSTGGVSLASALSGSVKTQAGLTFIISKSGLTGPHATVDKT